MIAPIHGVTLPTPAGGKYRQIMVDIDQTKLLAKGLTPLQVVWRHRIGDCVIGLADLRIAAGQGQVLRVDGIDDRGAQRHPGQLFELAPGAALLVQLEPR
jgi:hypothetical protein